MDNYPPMKTLKVDLTLGAFLKKAPQNSIIQKLYMHKGILVYPHPKTLRTKNHEKHITLSKLLRKLKH